MEETTLLFRHLPSELSTDERKDLLHHLGASRVQVMGRSGAMKNTAFAVFPSKEEASKLIKQLHQVEFMGSKLKVEFSHKDLPTRVASVVDKEGVQSKETSEDSSSKNNKNDLMPEEKEIKFDDTFNVWGLKHPRRPDQCYLYPPPTPTTLTNIMHALAAVPKFYVQVLHLMNKMDLPAPFGALTAAPPVRPDIPTYPVTDDVDQREMDISSETESELESDDEEQDKRPKDQAPVKTLPISGRRPEKHRKRPRLSELQASLPVPTPTTFQRGESVSVSQMFEQALSEHPAASTRKIELKLPSAIVPPSNPPSHPLSLPRSLPPPTLPECPAPPMPVPPPISSQTIVPPKRLPQQDQQVLPTPVVSNLQISSLKSHHPPAQSHLPQADDYQAQPRLQPATISLQSVYTEPVPAANTSASALEHQYDESIHLYDVPLPPSLVPHEDAVPDASRLHQEQEGSQVYSEVGDTGDTAGGGFGVLLPQPRATEPSDREEESTEQEWSKSKFISSSELKRLRLSHSEMKEFSVFRKYNEGEPSCRLYIKNLTKQVTEEDIHWVFGRYVNWDDETEKNIFDIRLMKEGRMKGQAFVTLPSEKSALSALKDTNGLLMREKPMVVQFARSAKAMEDEASKP